MKVRDKNRSDYGGSLTQKSQFAPTRFTVKLEQLFWIAIQDKKSNKCTKFVEIDRYQCHHKQINIQSNKVDS